MADQSVTKKEFGQLRKEYEVTKKGQASLWKKLEAWWDQVQKWEKHQETDRAAIRKDLESLWKKLATWWDQVQKWEKQQEASRKALEKRVAALERKQK